MTLCNFCDGYEIHPTLGASVSLPSYGQLEKNAAQGCEGCRFLRDTLRIEPKDSTKPADSEAPVFISQAWRRSWYLLSCPSLRSGEVIVAPCGAETFESDFVVPENPNDYRCWRTVRRWLDECIQHGCSAIADVPLPKRIIAVAEDERVPPRLFLPPPGTTGRFVALSHCWGKTTNMTKLLTENEAAWQHGIDVSALSQNFRDAMVVTRRLGFRYLWIDALCIVQDSAADWVEQSPQMASIYGTAALVVSAASAATSDEGFLRPRRSLCSPLLGPSRSKYLVAKTDVVGEYEWLRLPALSIVGRSVLNSRGWAAQERIMAARLLHYTTFEMIWECPKHCLFESTRPVIDEVSAPAYYTPDPFLRKAEMHKLVVQWQRAQLGPGARIHEAISNPNATLRAWFDCVQEFSPRQLTCSSDKLPAVAGLAVVFDYGLERAGAYLAGLWSGHLARCLAWQKQRSPEVSGVADCHAPSWSWASVGGRIQYAWEEAEHVLHTAIESSPWPSRHNPRLLDHHMVHAGESGPYMSVEEGSYIVLEGNCMDARRLGSNCEIMFDGRGYGWLLNGKPVFGDGPEDIVLMQLLWTTRNFHPENRLELCALLLRETESKDTFRRVGLVTYYLGREAGYVNGQFMTPMGLEESYNALGWQRRALKIV
ncbi:hypothetical protein AYL99_03636 [Fonsecaea erecta]|uniref:Heterokaryon incompatibility domain-containing protein n=1 Tax=Fonsecaea erecta TaxID=1367422 RepID=A0A178ZQG8_9EURO|nr:hypothetical protein AYL99_03636 [Fonsecaea erecta]OAP61433.1 hypothetical protein AYL99_03636 [Fonsecaea erecta]